MHIPCDCGHDAFHLVFVPPTGVKAVCTDCDAEQLIGETSMLEGP